MDYLELRQIVKDIIPRRSILEPLQKAQGLVKEKGRKKAYQEFSFDKGEFVSIQRLLNTEEMNSFLEVSLRAAHCPMPLNCDVFDGLRCPYACRYCLPSKSKILMADGSKKWIARINKGDRVISYNTNRQEIEISTVTKTMDRIAKDLLVISTKNREVKVTPEHPLFTKRGWIEAKDLNNEDEVLIW